ncbi:hypothetical protein EXIGLDRAFT_763134 [Exidia glandulosa HHB12029]|uniref:TPR-like protein n=1 Tax=Exidia glandulosa HHB12029 TaxID=1314781 RepID=A0A165M8E4_EXIGL|nr:hypothetical protein EXIGLDRAFT_763134 [Exidia glandulosa HHB12029]
MTHHATSPAPNVSEPAPSPLPSDPVDLATSIADASQHKERGNTLFKSGDWEGAATEYLVGLAALPPWPPLRKSKDDKGKGRERPEDDAPSTSEVAIPEEPEEAELKDEEPAECKTLRAVLYANVAACRAKQGDDKAVVELCTQALLDDPKYAKALLRRAAANEKIGTWSAMDAANAGTSRFRRCCASALTHGRLDYTTLLTIYPESSREASDIRRAQRQLTPRLEAAKKKEMDEMVSKMKGLGNSILGKFGLSTDNFQFTPNGQGGYSMNFVNNA